MLSIEIANSRQSQRGEVIRTESSCDLRGRSNAGIQKIQKRATRVCMWLMLGENRLVKGFIKQADDPTRRHIGEDIVDTKMRYHLVIILIDFEFSQRTDKVGAEWRKVTSVVNLTSIEQGFIRQRCILV